MALKAAQSLHKIKHPKLLSSKSGWKLLEKNDLDMQLLAYLHRHWTYAWHLKKNGDSARQYSSWKVQASILTPADFRHWYACITIIACCCLCWLLLTHSFQTRVKASSVNLWHTNLSCICEDIWGISHDLLRACVCVCAAYVFMCLGVCFFSKCSTNGLAFRTYAVKLCMFHSDQ